MRISNIEHRTHGAYIILECSIFSHSSNPLLSAVYVEIDLLHNSTYNNNNSSGCINKTYHFVPLNIQETTFLAVGKIFFRPVSRISAFVPFQMIHIFILRNYDLKIVILIVNFLYIPVNKIGFSK